MRSTTKTFCWLAVFMAIWTGGGSLQASPLEIAWSTYLGGGGLPFVGTGLAVDDAGNTYVAGGNTVAKIDPRGDLVFTVTLPANIAAIAVDAAGSIYVTGQAKYDVFVAKLDPSGSELLYSRLLGGSARDYGEGIAVDPQGFVYVGGTTLSSDFPAVRPVTSCHGREDAFAFKLTPDGSDFVYSTCVGGSGLEGWASIAADASGHAYLVGTTGSPDLPTVNAFQEEPPSTWDLHGFVAKILPSGGGLAYLTYLGGRKRDYAWDVAVDLAGRAFVAGSTESENFPILNGLRTQNTSEEGNWAVYDAFVTVFTPTGELEYSTYLGGVWYDHGYSIGLDAAGFVYVAGLTTSSNFPLKDPVQDTCYIPDEELRFCNEMASLMKLDLERNEIVYSTFLGDVGPWFYTAAGVLAVDPAGGVSVAGRTDSFPLVRPIQPLPNGQFLARLVSNHPPDCSAAFASAAMIWPPNGKMVPISILGVTDPESDPVALKITGISQDEPGGNFSGIGSSVAQVKAERDGKGDGRVYRIQFEAADPSGASCAGEVRVCVPHDQGKGGCVDGAR